MKYSTQIIASLIGLLLLLGSCQSERIQSSHNLLYGKILSVVHACGGFETYRNPQPSNTIAALKRSLAQGAEGIEFDVQMTADSQLVLFHDADLSRLTTCTGCVHAKTWAELSACRYKTRNGSLDGDYPIAKLDELIAVIQTEQSQAYLFANTKHFTGCESTDLSNFYEAFAARLVQAFEAKAMQEQLIIESLEIPFLQKVQAIAPNMKLIFDDEDFERGIQVVRDNHFLGLAISNGQVTEAQVKKAHGEGYWLGIWGVKVLTGTKEAVKKGPEFIMTDDLLMLKGQLKQ